MVKYCPHNRVVVDGEPKRYKHQRTESCCKWTRDVIRGVDEEDYKRNLVRIRVGKVSEREPSCSEFKGGKVIVLNHDFSKSAVWIQCGWDGFSVAKEQSATVLYSVQIEQVLSL